MTRAPVIEIGPAHLTLVQILVLVGLIRAISKGEWVVGGLCRIDHFLILWAALLIGSSFFHTSDAWIFRLGMVWAQLGSYFFFRVFVQDVEEILYIFKALCVILIPIAILMLVEKNTGKNFFAILGGVDAISAVRNGHVRAAGPFAHPILAGVVGATCFPMPLFVWTSHRKTALVGLFAAGGSVFASTSSGPIMMLLFIILGLAFWKVRSYLHTIRLLALMGVFALDAVMKDPVYFLMARIDISGGSTGWHRAQLIRSSIEHFDEWWLTGTDYTRHWMQTGVYINNTQVDITNHFLQMGVWGGIPLMIVFVMVLFAAFGTVGKVLRENESASFEHKFLIWGLGAILFGHVWNFFSISLFDQSIVFFYLVLACIGTINLAMPFSGGEAKQVVSRIRESRYIVAKMNIVKGKSGIGKNTTFRGTLG
ncbi:MAG: hypothetical protein ABL903_14610 [Methylococcales bacterium]